MKNIFDFFAALVLFIIVFPLFIPISLILKLVGERRVFYRQERVGKNYRNFYLIKFTTMMDCVKESPHAGLTTDSDPDVFPFGKFLRKTKLNELPQLINVLVGDMSLVGPRPLTTKTISKYSESIRETILTLRPGVTGIGSIVFRNEEKLLQNAEIDRNIFYEKEILPYKGALEEWYCNNRSILTDLKILIATVIIVIYPEAHIINTLFRNVPDNIIPDILKEK